MKKTRKLLLTLGVLGLTGAVVAAVGSATLDDIRMWDDDTDTFNTTTTAADAIDFSTTATTGLDSAVDSEGRVYMAYLDNNGADTHVYLSRFNGTRPQIWNQATTSWSDTFSNGTPIDLTISSRTAQSCQVAIDSSDNVYVAYHQEQDNNANNQAYVSRYNSSGETLEIWHQGTTAWTTNLTSADDAGDQISISYSSDDEVTVVNIGIDSNDDVYVVTNSIGSATAINRVFMSRYDSSATTFKIFDQATTSFLANFSLADPIDLTAANLDATTSSRLGIDSGNRVYVAYLQEQAATANNQIYLSRFNPSSTACEIFDGAANNAWTTDFDGGTVIGGQISVSYSSDDVAVGTPTVYVDSNDDVYVTFSQDRSASTNDHFHMAKYDYSATSRTVWDQGTSAFTTTISLGDPIDADTSAQLITGQTSMGADSSGNIYIAFNQQTAAGANNHIHLSRYEAATSVVKIWDESAGVWTSDFDSANAANDGIDHFANTADVATGSPQLVVNGDDVYVAYLQEAASGANNHLHMSLYDASATDILVWDNATTAFNTTRSTGDPIDDETAANQATDFDFKAATNKGIYYPVLQEPDGGNAARLHIGRFGTPSSSSSTPPPRSSSDSGLSKVCLISSESKSASILLILASVGVLTLVGYALKNKSA